MYVLRPQHIIKRNEVLIVTEVVEFSALIEIMYLSICYIIVTYMYLYSTLSIYNYILY